MTVMRFLFFCIEEGLNNNKLLVSKTVFSKLRSTSAVWKNKRVRGGVGGRDVFRKCFLALSDAMSMRRSSWGVEYFRSGANFLREAGFNGGRDRMNSRMISCASFFTFGASWPSGVITLFNLYLQNKLTNCVVYSANEDVIIFKYLQIIRNTNHLYIFTYLFDRISSMRIS